MNNRLFLLFTTCFLITNNVFCSEGTANEKEKLTVAQIIAMRQGQMPVKTSPEAKKIEIKKGMDEEAPIKNIPVKGNEIPKWTTSMLLEKEVPEGLPGIFEAEVDDFPEHKVEYGYFQEVGNETELNLAKDTPGFNFEHPIIVPKTVNFEENIECYEVRIPQSAARIYFPKNGVQPTTAEATEYCCANIDNHKDSPITIWYMQMFGIEPLKGVLAVCQQGFKDAKTAPIINLSEKKKSAVKNAFQKIASTSVGRTLLYRILIEIRRYRKISGKIASAIAEKVRNYNKNSNIGCVENNRFIFNYAAGNRENCRSIILNVHDSDGRSYFSVLPSEICLYIPSGENQYMVGGRAAESFSSLSSAYNSPINVLPVNELPAVPLSKDSYPLDEILYHEMNHWYHCLRHPVRFGEERVGYHLYGDHDKRNKVVHINRLAHALGLYYYQDFLKENAKKILAEDEKTINQIIETEQRWYLQSDPTPGNLNSGDLDRTVDFEEMRNMIGVPVSSDPKLYNPVYGTVNGDDLCENLYRMCKGKSPGLIYNGNHYNWDDVFSDKKLVKKIEGTLNCQQPYYKIINRLDQKDKRKINFIAQGIGNSYHSANDSAAKVKVLREHGFFDCKTPEEAWEICSQIVMLEEEKREAILKELGYYDPNKSKDEKRKIWDEAEERLLTAWDEES